MCSTAFVALGRAQATALGYSELPIAIIPHPFGSLSRGEVRTLARETVGEVVHLLCDPTSRAALHVAEDRGPVQPAATLEAPADLDELYKLVSERRWGDGMPIVPPTIDRVERMLAQTRRHRNELVTLLAPRFGRATVEHIAINGVLAGCEPEYLPVLITAIEAMGDSEFNLQSVQATTNPATPFLIINGPIAHSLGINSGSNCLGAGTRANATLGRALRLILQNVGGAIPGEMDRATQGQPGKYTFCCAENEAANPWVPLHVERGHAASSSTVTVAAISGTLNINTHARDSADLLRVIADAMAYAPSNDYRTGGAPWIVLAPEHAEILHRTGFTKAEVKRRLWELSQIEAGRMAAKDLARTQHNRSAELGELGPHSLVPISRVPEHIGIIVAGGAGTHSVYLPSYGSSQAITREITAPQ